MKLYSMREEQRKGYALILIVVFSVAVFMFGISWFDPFEHSRKMILMLFTGVLCGLVSWAGFVDEIHPITDEQYHRMMLAKDDDRADLNESRIDGLEDALSIVTENIEAHEEEINTLKEKS